MKANELMIGDWVLYNETPQQILEISGIDDEVYLETDELVHQSEIQPIPITQEILEKNGFVQSPHFKEVYRIVNYDEYLRVGINMKNGRYLNIIKTFEDGSEEFNYNTPIPKFVHELQHALRLCGIDKEIEL